MTMDVTDWARAVAEAYAADAKPPLAQDLVDQVRTVLTQAIGSETGAPAQAPDAERLNAALDAFEAELRAVVGPRVEALDGASGAVTMRHRSEAGQPLRAFGGQ